MTRASTAAKTEAHRSSREGTSSAAAPAVDLVQTGSGLQADRAIQIDIKDSTDHKVAGHLFPTDHQRAVLAALGARRPLLVYGEPGCGKSQLARAAAVALGRAFVSTVVDGMTQPRELLYEVDLVQRLAIAQAMAAARTANQSEVDAALELRNFMRPKALWWGLNATSAADTGSRLPEQAKGCESRNGMVVLLDEIDKADPSVPNGLLGALGEGGFELPDRRRVEQQGPFPLIVITSNEERTLPTAFVRRCAVLRILVPAGDGFETYLIERGRAHFGPAIPDRVYEQAAADLRQDREAAPRDGSPKPGQAEYLDLLRAFLECRAAQGTDPLDLIAELRPYFFQKHGDRHPSRT